jgi:CO/xanthine dehydrogenase FAD-binding subunit
VSIRNITSFERPATVEEAFALISSGGIPISGGTNVILHSPAHPSVLVDLTALTLAGIEVSDTGLTIGANTTLTELLEHPETSVVADGVIASMMRRVGSPLLRNVATVGGHVARGRLSDIITVFLALDAAVTIYDGESRVMPLADYFRHRIHRTTTIVTAVHIARPAEPSSAHFVKFSQTAFDLAILNCACRVDLDGDGAIAAARVVLGETPGLAASVDEAESMMIGRPLDAGVIERAAALAAEHFPARSDDRASADFRRHLAEVLVLRCLRPIAGRLT